MKNSHHGRYSLEIVRPQPTVKEVPKTCKPKTKWFRDPVTQYWVQIQKPTGKQNRLMNISF